MTFSELIIATEIGLIYGIVSMGIYITFRVINFSDLTCDGSFVLGGAVTAMMIQKGFNPLWIMGGSFAAGALGGMATAFLNLKLKISDILSGILVAFMMYSVNLKIMGDIPNIPLFDQKTLFSNHPQFLTIIFVCSFLILVMGYLLMTHWGLAMRSVGQNKILGSTYGIKVSTMMMLALMISNGIIGLGGSILTQYQGVADINSGTGTIVVGLAALMIGEKILPFSSPWVGVLSCMLGSILYRIAMVFAIHSDYLGLKTQDINLVTGCLIVLIMAFSRRKKC
jgi:putative ABC transport system permease protein